MSGKHSSHKAFRKIGLLGVAVATLASGWLLGVNVDPAQAGALEGVKSRGSLRAAGVVYPPFMIRKPAGSYKGIDVEILGRVAEDLGVKLEFVDAGWDTAVAGITTGKWEIVPSICITPARQEVVDFSESYITVGGVLGVRADNNEINTVEDANKPDVLFANVAGGWGEQIAEQAFPLAQRKAFGQATDADMLQEVLSGRADVAIFDAPVTSKLILDQVGPEKIKFIPAVDQPMDVLPCPVGFAVPKGDAAFKEYMDGFISGMKSRGELDKLFASWLTAEHISE